MMLLTLWLLLSANEANAATCDVAKVGDPSAILREVQVDDRAGLAAAWLAETCELPAALKRGLTTYNGVMPEQQPLVAAQTVAADPALIIAACAGGPGVIAAAMSADRAGQRAVLFDRCDLGRHKLIDRSTFVAATQGDPLLFLLAAEAVGPSHSDPKVAELLRALAGAPLPTSPPPSSAPVRPSSGG